MPGNYISVARPPKWLVDTLSARAKAVDLNLTPYTGLIVQHALKNQSISDDTDSPQPPNKTNSAASQYDGNINVPADPRVKKRIRAWGRPSRRPLGQQTLYILKKAIVLNPTINDLTSLSQ